MAMSVKSVIMVVVSLVVIAVVLPIGIGLTSAMGDAQIYAYNYTGLNESAVVLSDLADPTVITLLTILLPILAVIGIILAFIPRGGE